MGEAEELPKWWSFFGGMILSHRTILGVAKASISSSSCSREAFNFGPAVVKEFDLMCWRGSECIWFNLFYWCGGSRLAGIKHTFYAAPDPIYSLFFFYFRTINGMSKFRSTFIILGYFNFDALSLITMWRLWWLFAICWSLIGHFEWSILSHHQGDAWGKPKIGYYFLSQVCISTISFHSGITLHWHAYLVSFLFQVRLVSSGYH